MKFELDPTPDNHYIITSYEPGKVIINNNLYIKSLLVSSSQLITEWPITSLSDLTSEILATVLNLKPGIFILGSGERQQFLNPEILSIFYQHKIGVEIMINKSACYTYNVLVSENRNVLLGLCL